MIEVENLSFERNDQTLFQQICFSVNAGELLQIRGNNGSGKTTLLRILARLIEPHSGHIFWNNQDIKASLENYQQQLNYLGHQHGLKTQLTVYENLHLTSCLANKKISSEELENILQKVGLKNMLHTPVLNLSAGQTRRLALARLLLQATPLWLLDEPTTALDAQAQELLTQLLSHHLEKGGIAIIATHQPLSITGKTLHLGEHHV